MTPCSSQWCTKYIANVLNASFDVSVSNSWYTIKWFHHLSKSIGLFLPFVIEWKAQNMFKIYTWSVFYNSFLKFKSQWQQAIILTFFIAKPSAWDFHESLLEHTFHMYTHSISSWYLTKSMAIWRPALFYYHKLRLCPRLFCVSMHGFTYAI